MNALANEHMKEITGHVESIFQVMDRYQPSRPGSMAFTKMEEAILWLQVMVQQVGVKESKQEEMTPSV